MNCPQCHDRNWAFELGRDIYRCKSCGFELTGQKAYAIKAAADQAELKDAAQP